MSAAQCDFHGAGLQPKRVVTLFGCGGDRDRTKRPIMGQVAGELSDLVILTSDNPRSEDPLQIMNDVLVGCAAPTRDDCGTRPRGRDPQGDRRGAAGDIVILAGKGHETYQIFHDRTIHFDDREVAREGSAGMGTGGQGCPMIFDGMSCARHWAVAAA